MRKMVVLLLILMIPVVVFSATTGKIMGKVIDGESKEALLGVNVMVVGTSLGAATDENGEFFILNVSPGTWNIRVNMIGYASEIKQGVVVYSDLSSEVNFDLKFSVIEGEEVIVEAKRPLIQKDISSSRNTITSEQIQSVPVDNIVGLVGLSAGFVDGHARGGRDGEILFFIDGVANVDPMSNAQEGNISNLGIEEISVITGGFSAEYGNAQSGIVNVVTKEGGSSFSGSIRHKLSFDRNELQNTEFGIGGPIPFFNSRWFISGEALDTKGFYDGSDDKDYSLSGKYTMRATKQDVLTVTGTWGERERQLYNHRWMNNSYEDEDVDGDGILDNYTVMQASDALEYAEKYGLSIGDVDTETKRWVQIETDRDLDGNFVLGDGDFTKEDANGSNDYDKIDRNKDGDTTDVFWMADNLADFEYNTNSASLKWSHTFSKRTFIEIQGSRYLTAMRYNVEENINEIGLGVDYNGNDILESGVDLFTDYNENDYIDASEEAYPDNPEKWLTWSDVPNGNAQTVDGYYSYGTGTTYSRNRWNTDEKITWTMKGSLTSQVTNHHKLKSGFEYKMWDIFDHDVDLPSGGNLYGGSLGIRDGKGIEDGYAIQPFMVSAYLEDKMEYKGINVNAGLRYDYFDPVFDNYPSDPENPVINETTGGEVSDPRSVDPKYYWSPRLGITHPITEKDVL
ncbi:TonB-dependent receptor, partial [bacterium]|nr:TonB-dependent receptor [bacterium]